MNSTGGLYNKDVSQTHATIHFYDTSRANISGDEHHIGVAYPNITHSETGRILDAAVQVSYDAAHMTGGDTAVPFIDLRITERPDTYVSKFSSAILRLYADGKVNVITAHNGTSSIKELASSVWAYPTSPIANKASIQELRDGSEDKHYYGDGSENEQ